MDELSILRARVAILERQMERMNERMRNWIEEFDELLSSAPREEEKDEVGESTPMAE